MRGAHGPAQNALLLTNDGIIIRISRCFLPYVQFNWKNKIKKARYKLQTSLSGEYNEIVDSCADRSERQSSLVSPAHSLQNSTQLNSLNKTEKSPALVRVKTVRAEAAARASAAMHSGCRSFLAFGYYKKKDLAGLFLVVCIFYKLYGQA